ncbi:MAG TPA: hypothetical protein VKF36_20885 [Syntrophorhabdales bacterium]|nr:hypothetical protein [Syntrophorhabdales bacterium]
MLSGLQKRCHDKVTFPASTSRAVTTAEGRETHPTLIACFPACKALVELIPNGLVEDPDGPIADFSNVWRLIMLRFLDLQARGKLSS